MLSHCRRRAAFLLVVLMLFLAPQLTWAQEGEEIQPTDAPFLWRLEGDTPSFLFGTIHVPDDRVLALPDVVEEVLEATDALYTELPMDMATQMQASVKRRGRRGLSFVVGGFSRRRNAR